MTVGTWWRPMLTALCPQVKHIWTSGEPERQGQPRDRTSPPGPQLSRLRYDLERFLNMRICNLYTFDSDVYYFHDERAVVAVSLLTVV